MESEANCVFGKCLKFDPTDGADFIALSASQLPTEQITVATWVKVTSHANYRRFVVNRWENNAGDWLLFSDNINWIWGIRGVGGGQVNKVAPHKNSLEWTFLVGTYDNAANTQKFYVNGIEIGNPMDPGVVLTKASLTISDSASSPMTGWIDEVRIYSKALTLAQIEQLYALGLEKYSLAAKK
ncbi:MAG: LamG domain-containing protein [Candidatus Wildermuthbacteria bacterium]|nr:LamG domain-containing protein [Candidatus Wildermuthbacteria bacterium]